MPTLWLAQREFGWLSEPVMEYVAQYLDMPVIRVLEVASFYMMYNLVPVGRFHVQVCGTTPCMLRGSDEIMAACKARGMAKGHTTDDGLWTLTEVECMGNCASAPMVQINDHNYEDLTSATMRSILDALERGEERRGLEAEGDGQRVPVVGTADREGVRARLRQVGKLFHDVAEPHHERVVRAAHQRSQDALGGSGGSPIIAVVETYGQRYELVPELRARTKGEKPTKPGDSLGGAPDVVVPAGETLAEIAEELPAHGDAGPASTT